MYKNYGAGTSDILCLPFFIGYELLRQGYNRDYEEKLMSRWIIGGYEKSISFDKFRAEVEKSAPKKFEKRTPNEILDKVKDILGG